MSWKEELREASFRDIPFFVERSGTSFGRMQVEHVFPDRPIPFVEDLGRSPKRFRVEGYVLGADYLEQRDRLVAAVAEESKVGKLVHPYYGTLAVVCRGLEVEESTREGGIARLFFVFLEAGLASWPDLVPDKTAALQTTATEVANASSTQVAADLVIEGQPAFVVEQASKQAETLAQKLAGLDLFGKLADVQKFRDDAKAYADKLVELVASPLLFAQETSALLASIVGVAGGALAALEAYLGLLKVPPIPSCGTSSRALIGDANRDAVLALFRAQALGWAALSASSASWASYEDAIAGRNRVLDALDELEPSFGDQVFEALGDARRALVEALPPPENSLPHIAVFLPAETVAALLVAYRLYDDVGRESEILERNRIAQPGFVPGLTPLEVLVND